MAVTTTVTLIGTALVQPWWLSTVATVERDQRQQRLTRSLTADVAINRLLDDTLPRIPGASRIRVGLISNSLGATLRFDVTHGVAAAGFSLGELQHNVPLAQWANYIEAFLKNRCVFDRVSNPALSAQTRTRLEAMHTAAFLGCPIINSQNEMVGAVFINWDSEAAIPADIAPSVAILHQLVSGIARWLPPS